MKLTNRQIGRIARELCFTEREKTHRGIYVRTNSYSEVRGGRRVKKYWLVFSDRFVAESFVEDLTRRGENPIYKGYSYRVGYVVEFINEEEAEVKPKEKLEVPDHHVLLMKAIMND
ncbi:MAG: hypothetical protein ACR2M6_02710 [Vampirovibrionia bacterium]